MHILPAQNTLHFNLNKYLVIAIVAITITFTLFVGMKKLIESDQIQPIEVTVPPPITLTYDIKEKPLVERIKLKPKPVPLPQPKLIARVTESDPNTGFDPNSLISSFGAPKIKTQINPTFDSGGGDARPIVRVEPKYPTTAAKDGVEGWVKLSFSITASGTVSNIKVLDSKPKRTFNQAAKRALAKWKYKPNIQAGKAQAQDGMMVMLDFKLAS
ncbi:MAG: energy transducer TonB [Paraglaciecola sp.]|uniref:energy transducer TonB n=1 Tax=Paraglaciecola sp. TaxID=1920173 RepID=UPI0032975968